MVINACPQRTKKILRHSIIHCFLYYLLLAVRVQLQLWTEYFQIVLFVANASFYKKFILFCKLLLILFTPVASP